MSQANDSASNHIAVIGLSGCFPGAADVEQFWENLKAGRESVEFLSPEELARHGIDPAVIAEPNYVRAVSRVEGAEFFDNSFFGFTPREAEIMDPQLRRLLQHSWAALEDAGYNPDSYKGSIGVFAGAGPNSYFLENLYPNKELMRVLGGPMSLIDIFADSDALSTMISYKLNLRGPSMTIQTACSTSLVAVHVACQSLLSGESDMVLAGGVSIRTPQEQGYIHQEGMILSPDGHCRPFDAQAAGTVWTNGLGLVVLKRLSDALDDGDTIHAVIRGSAVNNDGALKAGFTAPSVIGQTNVIAEALNIADVSAETISYVEAHGTGTAVGDPIELESLTRAFRRTTKKNGFCAIGSVKSNIGHMDRAAGVVSLIKTVLALRHGQIPASLHYTKPNPRIDFANSPFYVADKLIEWKSAGAPRRAVVNCLGFGGTNAHLVLEEAPKVVAETAVSGSQLLVLSAKSAAALDAITQNLAEYLARHPKTSLAHAAFTLQIGRQAFSHRRMLVCRDQADAVAALRSGDAKRLVTAKEATAPSLVFLFPGQGAQHAAMGRELYRTQEIFKTELDRCAEILRAALGLDLREVLYPSTAKMAWAAEQFAQARVTQPALFAVDYALAKLWLSWGIKPQVMLGHSVGEFVAGCLAGVFSLADALQLVAQRAQLTQATPSGVMLSVRLSDADLLPLLGTALSLASRNSPTLAVVAGSLEAVVELEGKLTARGAAFQRLASSHAFHSAMMDPVVAPFTEIVKRVKLNPPTLPFVSNVTGKMITTAEATSPAYWAAQIRQTVRFSDGLALLFKDQSRVFLEVGPGNTLTQMVHQNAATGPAGAVLAALGGLPADGSETVSMLDAVGRVWTLGAPMDWEGFNAGQSRRRIPLPTYPFEKKRFWINAPTASVASPAVVASSPILEQLRVNAAVTVVSTATVMESTLAVLRKTLLAVSGVNAAEWGDTVTFFEAGLDSLLLAQVSRQLERDFGVRVGFAQLAGEFSTLPKLAAHIVAQGKGREPTALTVAASVTHAPVAAGAAPIGENQNSILLQIQSELRTLAIKVDSLGQIVSSQSGLNNKAATVTTAATPVAELLNGILQLPLAPEQQEIWLTSQFSDNASRGYNESLQLEFEGELKLSALDEALQELVVRHDALRTTFSFDGKLQRIASRGKLQLTLVDFKGQAPEEQARRLQECMSQQNRLVFNLADGPLAQAQMISLGKTNHVFHLTAHHLVADGWSVHVLMIELSRLYSAKIRGQSHGLLPAMSYADYMAWRGRPDVVASRIRAEAYWLGLLADRPAAINLPTDRPWPTQRSFETKHVRTWFSLELRQRIKQVSAEMNCTLFHFLLGTFNVWLHRLTEQNEIVVGVPTAGQIAANLLDAPGSESLVGHSVNLLPMRAHCEGGATFRTYLKEFTQSALVMRDHQDIAFGDLVEKLALPRQAGRTPLVSVTFNLNDEPPCEWVGLKVKATTPVTDFKFFDLTVNVTDSAHGLLVAFDYNTDVFEAATVERWQLQWRTLMEGFCRQPDSPLSAMPLVSAEEQQKVLVEWNRTDGEFPRDTCLHELFEAQAASTPAAVAVSFYENKLTYAELNARADRLAEHLRSIGVKPDALVGLCVERSLEMLVGILGILKAGGAYVPIDPAYPADRIAYVLADANACALVTQRALLAILPESKALRVLIDEPLPEPAARSASPSVKPTATNLAYVIYTSGSTGKPKGVQIEHRAVVNFIQSMRREPGMLASDVLLSVTTLSFDIAGLEMHLPLAVGARIVIASQDDAIDGAVLLKIMERERISFFQATPATWRLLLAAGWKGTPGLKVLCGGEPLPADLAKELIPRCAELWNMYGPTETTIWSTCCRVTDAAVIHIGRPIANTEIYILDAKQQAQPVGVAGELLIGGVGLARGYFNREELTADRFITHPFKPGQRLYRTGDLARYRPDGNIDCLGRLDFQVKIRGFRIELGEIENQLAAYPSVKQAVVIAREDTPGDVRLVAYLVAHAGPKPTAAELREHLRQALPEYMIPAVYVLLDALPLTPNAKIDRKALPVPQGGASTSSRHAIAPRTDEEKRMAAIFERVLNTRITSVYDSFFDLGGHSLLAVKLMTAIATEFGVRLPLARLFADSTVEKLAAILSKQTNHDSHWASLVPIRPQAGNPTLFLVHGAGGNILLYRELAEAMGPEVSVYGFQSQGLDYKTAPLTRIETMAGHYVKELRAFQPVGPYHLAGYCMGGTVAYEMACLLRQQGEQVGLVALLDTYNFGAIQRKDGQLSLFSSKWQKIGFHLANIGRLGPRNLPAYFIEKFRMAVEAANDRFKQMRSSLSGTAAKVGAEVLIQKINDDSIWLYKPQPYAGRLMVVRPQKNYDFMPDAKLGWGDLVGDRIDLIQLPVNPHAMLIRPCVSLLAHEMKLRLVASGAFTAKI